MQRAFLVARGVGVRSVAGLGSVLLFLFVGDSFAAGEAGQMLAQDSDNKDVIVRPATVSDVGSTSSAVLPLDHGPRATTTPWLNQQRRLKAAAAASAARHASSVGTGTAEPAQH